MSESRTAFRYASALYQEAQDRGITDKVIEDIDLVAESLDGSRELRLFFASPIIGREKKAQIVDRLFGPRVCELMRDFLHLLIEKGREEFVEDIAAAFQTLRDRAEGIVEVKVHSALPLSDRERDEISETLAAITDKTVRLVVEVKPNLLGGVVIRVGDTVYDGSVQHQLAVLRERMEHGSFQTN